MLIKYANAKNISLDWWCGQKSAHVQQMTQLFECDKIYWKIVEWRIFIIYECINFCMYASAIFIISSVNIGKCTKQMRHSLGKLCIIYSRYNIIFMCLCLCVCMLESVSVCKQIWYYNDVRDFIICKWIGSM